MSRESILVYAPSWIGDAVISLGAVRALRKARPDARISVLARPWVAELYEGVSEVDARLSYDPRGAERGIRSLVQATARAREERFDVCLLLPNAFRAAAFARLAGVPERWGYATESRGFLLTRRVPPAPRPFGRHQAYYYLELMSGLGFETGEPDLRLHPPASMRSAARELLVSAGWDGRSSLVGAHPGATNSRSKMWMPSRFAEALSEIAAATGARAVVLGGPRDRLLADEVASRLDRPPIRLEGRTTLGQLMGVIAELAVFLSNDSGPMHLAAALGTPTVAVFGPTDPTETGPFRAKARVVREIVDCSPCLYRDCPIDHRCMERVSVVRVVEQARELLAEELALTGATGATPS
jgi:lipopolysaccharide heptosyltransferase II